MDKCSAGTVLRDRIGKRHEWVHSHHYKYDRFDPPLKVIAAGLSQWGPNDQFRRKNSRVFSVNIVTKGDLIFVQNAKEYLIKPMQVFMPRRGCNHWARTGPSGFLHKRFMLFDGPILDAYLRATGLAQCDRIVPHAPQRILQITRKAFRLMESKETGFTLALSRLAHELLLELSRSIAPDYPAEIRDIIEYMRRNLNRKVTLKRVCARVGMSIRTCNRLFQQHVKLSPMSFYMNQKMNWAQDLLLNTPMPIKGIASTLGYEDPFYFSTQFKKHFGFSPRAYRDRQV